MPIIRHKVQLLFTTNMSKAQCISTWQRPKWASERLRMKLFRLPDPENLLALVFCKLQLIKWEVVVTTATVWNIISYVQETNQQERFSLTHRRIRLSVFLHTGDCKGRKLANCCSEARSLDTARSSVTQQWRLWKGKPRDYIRALFKHQDYVHQIRCQTRLTLRLRTQLEIEWFSF